MEIMKRPNMEILSDDALVPTGAFIKPPPNVFTHRLKETTAFRFYGLDPGSRPDGHLDKDSKVTLLRYDGDKYCRVVDEQGLYVEIEYEGLEPL